MIIRLTDNCLPTFLDQCEWIDAQEGFVCYPWEVTPREYLQFASADLAEGQQRSRINAIGNAKRAIHSHVDFLLHNCGRCLRQANFPTKLQTLQKLGVVAPSLLNKYNRLRNLMEHEYVCPTQEQASEVVDVATLFIEATRSYTRPLPSSMLLRTRDGKQVCKIECNWDERLLVIMADPVPADSCGACVIMADTKLDLWTQWVSKIMQFLQDSSDPYVKCENESSFAPSRS